ncbi:MAG: DNA translocase FtsK [Pleurocapsa sp. MO_226.B13]|nr:DNA translocase FtsK [Pleurocapsa sp. MO_226.B13]
MSKAVMLHYLETVEEIRGLITYIADFERLWLDTEIADWWTKNPRLSLIQVLADPEDLTGESTYILDVLDKPEIISEFIDRIMINPGIEKVFHNASFDLKYLGKEKAKNVTCTLKIAKKISKEVLGTSNLKLKTIAVELCGFDAAEIANEQASNWGKRPLSEAQIKYAQMDVVYLAQLHHYLLEFKPDMSLPHTKSFSVTDVRVAVECPRLFYLGKHFGGKTLFMPKLGISGIGNTFHKLANDFVATVKQEPQYKALFEASVEKLEVDAIAKLVEDIASQMQSIFYSLVFFPKYLQPAIKTKPESALALDRVWQAIGNLIYKWTELLIKNRLHCNANKLFETTFIATESKLNYKLKLPNGTSQPIAGKLDCLIYDYSQNSLCVVELKTYVPVDPSAQLAQVALYSYMIQQTKKVPVDSAVYCVLPEFKEYYYPRLQLETNLHQVIPHKLQQMQQWLQWQLSQPDAPPATSNTDLCEICPQQAKCQSHFPPITKTKPEPPKPPKLNSQPKLNPEPIGRELVEILRSFKVNVKYIGAIAGTTFIRLKLKPAKGVKVASILKLAEDLQVQLGIARPPLIATQAGYVSVDLPREDRQVKVTYFKDYIQPQQKPSHAPITIAIGVDLEGKLIEANLADPNTCHFLVGGTTGSGKSEFLRSLLLSLIYRHTSERVKIALVDPKRVTFPEFEQMPWLLSPVVKDSEAAISLMEELVAEMEKRYQLFELAGCPHLDAYNQKQVANKHLPRIICIFDEYADFMTEKETRKALEASIKRLGGMARAAGIHLIVATQRPEAGVVTPIIRSNLPGRVALTTASEADSKIVLGGTSTEAACLLGKGDLFLQVNAQLQRLQSLYAPEIDFP